MKLSLKIWHFCLHSSLLCRAKRKCDFRNTKVSGRKPWGGGVEKIFHRFVVSDSTPIINHYRVVNILAYIKSNFCDSWEFVKIQIWEFRNVYIVIMSLHACKFHENVDWFKLNVFICNLCYKMNSQFIHTKRKTKLFTV